MFMKQADCSVSLSTAEFRGEGYLAHGIARITREPLLAVAWHDRAQSFSTLHTCTAQKATCSRQINIHLSLRTRKLISYLKNMWEYDDYQALKNETSQEIPCYHLLLSGCCFSFSSISRTMDHAADFKSCCVSYQNISEIKIATG